MEKSDKWLDGEFSAIYWGEIKPKKDNEYDMLIGNMNRMCVCDDEEELYIQFYNAIRRLVALKDINTRRIEEGNKALERLKK